MGVRVVYFICTIFTLFVGSYAFVCLQTMSTITRKHSCTNSERRWSQNLQIRSPDARTALKMAKGDDTIVQMEGYVMDALPNAMFHVELDPSKQVILAHASGKLRKHCIKILPGDRVKVEMSVYDLSKGRIIFRLK